jgi:hypothetical protein
MDDRTARLIVAARVVAWELEARLCPDDEERMRELREASEAFAVDLPWDDEQ